ncbi:hypothetical protein [Barnesiella intestinihominis]|uniref:hypothetical protein n=1 Tax=Barnesiella intestinihominis TaxID=487174 RepID=UPI0026723830|nr:hypothetical protein [Barnesiella intestinihominis]
MEFILSTTSHTSSNQPTHNFYLPCITKRQDTPQQNIMDKTALPEGTYKKVID